MDILTLKGISKKFAGVTVLNDISFSIRAGEVHALLGENGAGKSTLIKTIAGIYQPNKGSIEFCGQEVKIKDVKNAKSLGISVIHQEIALCPNLTVAENIVLGNESTQTCVLNNKNDYEFARNVIALVDDSINIYTKVEHLTIAQQQIVEIAKAIAYDAKLVIMDEPTSSLSDTEVKNLYKVVKQLKDNGVAILYVSHRLEEIFDLADRVTVLRDGNYVDTILIGDTDTNRLIHMLVGRELTEIYNHKNNSSKQIALEMKGLSRSPYFSDINMKVHKGEIVGVFGLVGAGRTEVVQTVFGVEKADCGEIKVFNERLDVKNTKQVLQQKIALIPESRKEQGIIAMNSISFNASLCVLEKYQSIFGLKSNELNKYTNLLLERLGVKMNTPSQSVISLSGGNQQKVVFAKMLATMPEILVMDEPTRGVDVGAKAEIYSLMDELAANGTAILMISSELPEIINMCDRVYVMCEGHITLEAEGEDINQFHLMKYAIGGC